MVYTMECSYYITGLWVLIKAKKTNSYTEIINEFVKLDLKDS